MNVTVENEDVTFVSTYNNENIYFSSDELDDLLKDLKKESYNLRFQKKNGQLDKTGRIKQVKKDIARIKTKINEEILGENNVKKNIER